MKDFRETPEEIKERVIAWLFLLVMRLYGQNIYSDESYIWKILEINNLPDVDSFFSNVLQDYKVNHRDIAKLYKTLQKVEDILGR